jgi:hypothetical protein
MNLRLAALVAITVAVAGSIAPMQFAPAASAAPDTAPTPADTRLAEMASPSPFRGLVYDGLSLGREGSSCDGGFEVKSRTGASLGCSHGPDPAPPGIDVRKGRSDAQLIADGAPVARQAAAAADYTRVSAAASLGIIGCIGDGTSGPRVQAIYAVAADRTDRSATVLRAMRATYAPRVDWQVNQSAAETGGEAHVRFVTEAAPSVGCQLSVPVVRLSAAGDDSFSNTVSELKAQGYTRADRKYLVWTDAEVLCGVGTMYSDTKPGLNNLNNGYAAMFARIDSSCWNYAEGHELMHNLGAVQQGAPHATRNGHCFDQPDDLCYDDGSGVAMVQVCAGRNSALFDCNHDDYFYAGLPPAGNWLATHWNTFSSSWLLPSALTGGTTSGSGSSGSTATGTTTPIPPVGTGPARHSSGYWMLTSDGHVFPFGAAGFYGQPYPQNDMVAVELEPTPSGGGYRVLDSRGTVRSYGDAPQFGSVDSGVLGAGETAVSLSATPSGAGYWVFTSRGRAVPFGDAGFFGDASGIRLNRPVVGSVATPTGLGYYLFASDGGIFTFGDAAFRGSTGNLRLNKPVVAMAVPAYGNGYWLVGSDGGLFAFGAAGFYGSMGNVRLNRPVSTVVPGRNGYLMVGEDGGAFAFGDVSYFGSLAGQSLAAPVVSVALQTTS